MSNEAKMVSVPRELAVRIEQILTGGHGAEAWAPTIVELRAALAADQQHQGEPVALPARKSYEESFSVHGQGQIMGCNACRDEIAKLGPLYTHPAPVVQKGERVGEVVAFGEGLHEIAWVSGRMPGLGAVLYTRADAGEVERLRDALVDIACKASESRSVTRRLTWIEGRAQSALEGKDWAKHVFQMPDPLNAAPKAERLRKLNRDAMAELEDRSREIYALRAQLAERNALLGAIAAWSSETRAAVLEAFQAELNESASYAWYDAAIADLMKLVETVPPSAESEVKP